MEKRKRPIGRFVSSAMLCALLFPACEAYLLEKPDKKMTEPMTLADCEALLDNSNEMNLRYPAVGEAASDNYFLKQREWESLTAVEDRANYLWNEGHTARLGEWMAPYKTIALANQVLETLGNIRRLSDPVRYDAVHGSALFFRGYALYFIAQVFAPPYKTSTAATSMGIPLPMSADIGVVHKKATLEQTYVQIISDFKEAAALLPENVVAKTRPSKVAALAALARTCMTMERYEDAVKAAESALDLQDVLLDYTQLDPESLLPFRQFNDEVIFHASTAGNSALAPARARVDTVLYASYDEHDLRKQLFFRVQTDGYPAFKGSYDGTNNASPFAGIAVDEVYLIFAEALARTGRVAPAMNTLNRLLRTRWETDYFLPYSAVDEDEAVGIILSERRKELLFRNLRWGDLKRLNGDRRFSTTLVRLLNGERHELPPGDFRYTMLIPIEVIENSSIIQNRRK